MVALGLLSRRHPLPGVFAEHTGDALYTVAAFCALALVRPGASGALLAIAAWVGSALVEVSQLASWQWLATLRANPVGALFLGQGWKGEDLIAYAAGALFAFCLDAMALRWRVRRELRTG